MKMNASVMNTSKQSAETNTEIYSICTSMHHYYASSTYTYLCMIDVRS